MTTTMTMTTMEPCVSLKPLLRPEVFGAQDELTESLRNHGQLAPVLVFGNLVVDGMKRWVAARNLGWSELLVSRISDQDKDKDKDKEKEKDNDNEKKGSRAWVLRWQANRHRTWNLIETALGFLALSYKATTGPMVLRLNSEPKNHLSNEGQPSANPHRWAGEFCRSLHITPSPHVEAGLKFVAEHSEYWPDFLDNRLTLAILRDLAHHEERLAELIPFFLKLDATMGEKRLLAGLLRQCAARGMMPELTAGKPIKKVIAEIEAIVQPRRVEAGKRFLSLVDDLGFPSRTEVLCDPTFEKPGVDLRISLKRHEIKRLEEISSKLHTLFQRMPEI